MSTNDVATEAKAKERNETLQKYVSDMMAVEEHIGSAVKRQNKDGNVDQHLPQARQLISKIAETTERHEQALKHHLSYLGGDSAKGIKEVATAVLGTLAGIYDKVRTEPVAKMLRDDYTALNLATIGYTMLHTTGLALNDQATADLALRHLREYTKIVMEINEVIPSVVVTDLRNDGGVIDDSALQTAVANTQSAWQPSGSGSGTPNTNGHQNAASNRTVAKTSKRTTVSRKGTNEDPSDSIAESTPTNTTEASATSSAGRKRSSASSSPSTSAATATSHKRSGTATTKPSASEGSTTPKKSSSTGKRKGSESKAPSV